MTTAFRQRPATRVLIAMVVTFASAAAHGEIVVEDRLDDAGELILSGSDWRATLRRSPQELMLGRDGQFVRMGLVGHADDESREPVSSDIVHHEESGGIELRLAFMTSDGPLVCGLQFAERGALRVVPGEGMCGIRIECPVAAGVLPGVRLDDVLFVPGAFEGTRAVHVPSENWFAALLAGQAGMVACAWPDGDQALSLVRGDDRGAWAGLTVLLDDKPLHLELLTALGIWHREDLLPEYLERTVRLGWKPPFPAEYRTQLALRTQTDVRRTFSFRRSPLEQYLPEVGRMAWPVWFDEERPLLRLSKRIPPAGDAVIYPMDGADCSVMGFIRRTPLAEAILQRSRRKPLPEGPRGAPNVGFIACGGTKVMRDTILALGLQNRERAFLTEYADFLADYVAIVQQKSLGYLEFVEKTRGDIRRWSAEPGLTPEARVFLEQMMARANATEKGLRLKIAYEGTDSPEAHIEEAAKCAERLKELLATPGREAWPECDALIDTCNWLAWAQSEQVGMRFSALARDWAQDAALGCASAPDALGYAQDIRASIRDALNGAAPW